MSHPLGGVDALKHQQSLDHLPNPQSEIRHKEEVSGRLICVFAQGTNATISPTALLQALGRRHPIFLYKAMQITIPK